MKRLQYVAALVIIAAVAAITTSRAQGFTDSPAPSNLGIHSLINAPTVPISLDGHFPVIGNVELSSKGDKVQRLTWGSTYLQYANAQYTVFNNQNTLVYVPATNSLHTVMNPWTYDNQQNLTGGSMIHFYSLDNGTTWTQKELFSKAGRIFVHPTFAICSPSGVSSVEDLDYLFNAFEYRNNMGQYQVEGTYVYMLFGGNDFEYSHHQIGQTSSPYAWWMGSLVGNPHQGSRLATFAGRATNSGYGSNFEDGTYAQWSFDFSREDFTSTPTMGTPAHWATSNFYRGSGASVGNYNGPISVDYDAEGTAYAAVYARFADDGDYRVPAVSKAAIGAFGASWSEFVRMPVSLLNEYAAANGAERTFDGLLGYARDGFVVTGPDAWSYMFRVYLVQGQSITACHLLEARMKNGTWSLSKVAEIEHPGPPILYWDRERALANGKESLCIYTENWYGNEISAARTADGSHLVVTWIDINVERPLKRFSRPYDVLTYDRAVQDYTVSQVDSSFYTDLFFSVRAKDGSWNNAYNLTNDATMTKATRMPKIIPSATKVPVSYMKGMLASEINPSHPLANAYPDELTETLINGLHKAFFATFNALNPSSVTQDPPPVAVSNVSVFPNPATQEVEFAFGVPQAGRVTLRLFNSLGTEVATLLDSFLEASLHGVSVDLGKLNLPSGAYRYSFTASGQTASGSLIVSR